MRKTLILLLIIINFYASAQISNGIKPIIDTLCSPYFSGRGYVDGGCEKAADFLTTYFNQLGIDNKNIYTQEYPFNVNTFPKKMQVVINDSQRLVAGKAYLVDAASAGGHYSKLIPQRLSLASIQSKEQLLQLFKKLNTKHFAYIIDSLDLLAKLLHTNRDQILMTLPKGVFIIPVPKKLTWDVATWHNKACVIYMLESYLTDNFSSIDIDIDQRYIKHSHQKNILALIPGKSDSILIFSAHYDHLGKMGSATYFPGASDNASGTAMLLMLAQYYKEKNDNKYTMVFIAFSGEEAGLLGSHYFIEHPLINLNKIKFLTNIDIAGDATNGITVVNSTVYKNQFDLLTTQNSQSNLLPEIRSRGKAAISDHYYFSEKNIPSFFIYTNGGKGYYHDIYDQANELSLHNIDNLFNLLIQFYSKL